MIFKPFPQELQMLQQELLSGYHIALTQKFKNEGDSENALEIIAAHCDLLLDGYYSSQDLIKLCGILYGRLVKKREKLEVVTPSQVIINLPSQLH